MIEFIEQALISFNKLVLGFFWYNVNFFSNGHIPLVVAVALIMCFYYMVTLRFSAIFYLKYSIKMLFSEASDLEKKKNRSVSSFRALFTSIAGAAGLGNIAGVAIGITIGGPGVVFWILVAAIVCMPLRFAEVYLGHKYRVSSNGEYNGGPYYYIRYGLEKLGFKKIGHFLAVLYSVLLIISVYGGATSFQTSQSVKLVADVFDLSTTGRYIMSIATAVLVFCIVAGGIKRVGSYCSSIIMVFIGVYFVALIASIIYYHKYIPEAFSVIIKCAFTHSALYGGTFTVFAMAFQRLQLANETGFGTAAIIHSNSNQNDSVREALVAMTSPVIDAIFVCFVTGLVICLGRTFNGYEGIMMIQEALSRIHPAMKYFLPITIPVISLNVMIAWSYYGVRNLEFLTKTKKFSLIYIASCSFAAFLGGVIQNLNLFVDLTNSLLFCVFVPNVIALIMLRKEVIEIWSKYVLKLKYDKNS